MKEQFEIIENLTPAQKKELDKDIQELYIRLQQEPEYQKGRVKDINVNANLLDEVFLNLTIEFGETTGDKVKGKITQVYEYKNKSEYVEAINS